MPLTSLQPIHRAALADFLLAFERAGEPEIPGWFCDPTWPFPQVVSTLAAWARGEQLQAGWVPCSTVFLQEQNELVGLFNFRHHLSPALERYGGHVGYSVRPDRRSRGHATTLLQGAVELGRSMDIQSLVLTCDAGNAASARVIRKCGGVLQEQFVHPGQQRDVLLWRVPT